MRSLLLLSVVMATGCGGNWSNSDLTFSNALPRRDDLRSRLPASTAQPLEGVSTRRDGLMVGDPSSAYAATRKAVTDYNGMLDLVLGVVDQVRLAPPTSRTTDSRTWGPFADSNNPGREVQVVIARVDDVNFEWRIESRPTNGEFLRILTGNFKATATARRGQGTFVVHAKDFRDVIKVDENMKQLDQIDVGYVTDSFPQRVEMLFAVKAGSTLGISSIGYTARRQEDGSGALRFLYALTGADVSEVEFNAAWRATGEGKATGVVTRGTYAGFNVTECWGRSFTVAHYAESWPTGTVSGPASDCPMIDGF